MTNKYEKEELEKLNQSLASEPESNDESKGVIRKLCCVTCVCILFMITEIVGGYIANSLAIMSDAAHLMSDLVSFSISMLSVILS